MLKNKHLRYLSALMASLIVLTWSGMAFADEDIPGELPEETFETETSGESEEGITETSEETEETEETEATVETETSETSEEAEVSEASEVTEITEVTEATDETEPSVTFEETVAVEETEVIEEIEEIEVMAAPAAPTGIYTCVDSYNSVTVCWNAVSEATGYQVWAATSASGTYQCIANTTSTSTLAKNLYCGTTYNFKVRAYTVSGGKTTYGAYGSVVTGRPVLKPAMGVSATPSSYTSVTVGWNAVAGAEGYQIWRATSLDGPYVLLGSTTKTSRVSTSLDCGTTYYYKVRPYLRVNGKLVYGPYSTVVNAKPSLDALTGTTAVKASYNSVNITWNAVEGAEGYQIWRSTSSSGSYVLLGSTTKTNRLSTSLDCGTTYYYKVRPYLRVNGKLVYGSYGAVVSAKPTLNAMTGVSASRAGYNSVNVSWSAVDGAEGYQIWRSTSADGSYVLLGSTTKTSRVSTSLDCGTTYYYKVRPYLRVNGKLVYGSYSSVVSARPTLGAVSGAAAAKASFNSVNVTWNALEGAEGYQIWRSTSANGSYVLLGSTTKTNRLSTSLTYGTTYYYKVRPYLRVNGKLIYGEYSNVVSARPCFDPVTGLKTFGATTGSIKVSFNPVAGATYYQVYMSGVSSTGPWTLAGEFTDTTVRIRNLASGSDYWFVVRPFVVVNGTRIYGNYSSNIYGKTVNEEHLAIWNALVGWLGNEYGAAGLMGNLYAESTLRSNNLENYYEYQFDMTDTEYTEAVDEGDYDDFVDDCAGYGLAQWTYWTRKKALKDFADDWGTSIGDLDMQLAFLEQEISNNYPRVLSALRGATSIMQASNTVLFYYENPANQDEDVQERRAGYGQTMYDTFHYYSED